MCDCTRTERSGEQVKHVIRFSPRVLRVPPFLMWICLSDKANSLLCMGMRLTSCHGFISMVTERKEKQRKLEARVKRGRFFSLGKKKMREQGLGVSSNVELEKKLMVAFGV